MNYKLIYYFITVPISRDPETIEKIIQSLTEGMEELDLHSKSELLFYERLTSEAHLEKL